MVEVCRRYGVLVIADEVMTGFGRTGRWFGVDQWGITPRHRHGRQGHDQRLRAVRVRGGERRDLRGGRPQGVRPRVHVVAQRARGRGRARDVAAPARRRPGRPRARPGREDQGGPHGGARRRDGRGRRPGHRDDARDRARDRPRLEGAVPAAGAGRRAGRCRRPRRGAAPVLLDRSRRRRQRRPHHARSAVHPDRRRHRRAGRADGRGGPQPSRERPSGWSSRRTRGSTTTGRSIRSVPIACCSRGT